MSAVGYLKFVLKDVEATLGDVGKKLPSKALMPFTQIDYKLELDDTTKLNRSCTTYFQGLIGILRWCIKLRCMDIITEVTKLSSFLVSPREGHLEQAFHILAYLKKHLHSSLVFDDTEPDLSDFHFKKCDWEVQYLEVKEPIPNNAPKPLGHGVMATCYVDASYTGCQVTCCSHTGTLIFVNKTLIIWYSK